MKYYKRLLENKAYKVFAIMAVPILLGIFICYKSYDGYQVEWIVLITGLVVAYQGLVFIPVVSRYAQDLSEFKVEVDEAYIYIEFRKYKWKIKREHFHGGACLMFFDEHRHFITMRRAYQVYCAICDLPQIKGENQCAAKYKIDLIPGAEVVTEEEKERFCRKLKLNKNCWFMKICSIFSFLIGISSFNIVNQTVEKTIPYLIGGLVVGGGLGVTFILTGRMAFQISNEGKKEYKYLLKHDLFKVRVYAYDRLRGGGSSGAAYYIKISDGKELHFEEWLEVTKKQYERPGDLEWYAYYYKEENGAYKVRVLEPMGL